jgi:hypothetical protein
VSAFYKSVRVFTNYSSVLSIGDRGVYPLFLSCFTGESMGFSTLLKKKIVFHHVGHWPCAHSSRLISVKMPAIILILLSYLPNIFMVLDLNAFVFFHMSNPPFLDSSIKATANLLPDYGTVNGVLIYSICFIQIKKLP